MKVNVKKLSEDAVVPFKTYDSDFCYDVVAINCTEIAPDIYRYGTGLAFQIERDKGLRQSTKVSIDFRPRSSVWKTGMILANCEGTIDEEYTGEVTAVFYHVMKDLPRYQVGDKIGQIKIGFSVPIEFVEVESLKETKRGDGGYGSTGK